MESGYRSGSYRHCRAQTRLSMADTWKADFWIGGTAFERRYRLRIRTQAGLLSRFAKNHRFQREASGSILRFSFTQLFPFPYGDFVVFAKICWECWGLYMKRKRNNNRRMPNRIAFRRFGIRKPGRKEKEPKRIAESGSTLPKELIRKWYQANPTKAVRLLRRTFPMSTACRMLTLPKNTPTPVVTSCLLDPAIPKTPVAILVWVGRSGRPTIWIRTGMVDAVVGCWDALHPGPSGFLVFDFRLSRQRS